MNTTFDKCTQEDFDRILDELVGKMSAAQVLAIDGVRELVKEELNNEVLEEWQRQNPELAQDWSQEQNPYLADSHLILNFIVNRLSAYPMPALFYPARITLNVP